MRFDEIEHSSQAATLRSIPHGLRATGLPPATRLACIWIRVLRSSLCDKGDGMNDVEPQPRGRRGNTGRVRDARRVLSRRQRLTAAAWERFTAGDDAVRGVRTSVLLSWYRCRDLHQVSPQLTSAPEAYGHSDHSLVHDVIFTKLGGAAGVAANSNPMRHSLIAVTDGFGRILASWGPRGNLRHGSETSLAPGFSWSEQSSGTNGMGTALESGGITLVEGAEHWCQGFHQWNCAGMAIRDPVTRVPLAALNVSCWGEELPAATSMWLRRTVASLESELRGQAIESGTRLVDAFMEAEAKGQGVALALDVAGRVVIASQEAQLFLGVECPVPAIDPNVRLETGVSHLPGLVEQAVREALKEPQWCGFAELFMPSIEEPLMMEFHPVRRSRDVIGMLLIVSERPCGKQLGDAISPQTQTFPLRIAGVRGSRIVLLAPQEIRYAEADSHAVWLVTDQGRLRAATRGIDNIDRQLGPHAFLRVHRRFLVNVARIKEVEPSFKGALTLTTSAREHEAIPVSRRHAAQLRQTLGI